MHKDENDNSKRLPPKISIGPELIDLFTSAYAANLPVLLEGGHGVGKSEISLLAAQSLGIEGRVIDLSVIEPVDLTGLPAIAGGRTVYAPPTLLPSEGRGLLVFEELNRCPRYMQTPCLQLLTSRRLNDYVLPPGWLPCACINPDTEGYQVNELDPALLSRFIRVRVRASVSRWLEWAKTNNLHSGVVAFVGERRNLFSEQGSNPRSWTYVARYLDQAERDNVKPSLRKIAVGGLVGRDFANALFTNFRDSFRPMPVEQLLQSDNCAARADAWKRDGRMDLLYTTLCALMTYLQSRDNRLACTSAQAGRVVRFINALPGDMRREGTEFLSRHQPGWLEE